MNLQHAEATSLFSAYVDHDLATDLERSLEHHLAACRPCRAEYEQYAAAVTLVRQLPRARAPASFSRRVIGRTRQSRRRRAFQGNLALIQSVSLEVALPILLIACVVLALVLLAP